MGPGGTSLAVAIVASGLVGLAVGSFLNVVAYRLPRKMSVVRPASHCPACGTTLGPVDTVPLLSWIVLGGRCRHCQAPVSARYPLVEGATGAAFAGLAATVGGWAPLPSLAVVAACAIVAVVIDGDTAPIPAPVTLAATAGALSLVIVAVADGRPGRIGWALAGAAIAAVAAAIGGVPWERLAARSRRGRAQSAGGARTAGRRAILAALGWSAGWLWPLGGPLVAAWVLAVGLGRRLRGASAVEGPVTLIVLASGAFAALLAGAVVGRP